MYKSPIEIIDSFTNDMGYKIRTETDKLIMQAVYNVGVNVDKAELIKALEYDRDQYEEGYMDGKESAAIHSYWIEEDASEYNATKDTWTEKTTFRCARCYKGGFPSGSNYCPNCGARMDSTQITHLPLNEGDYGEIVNRWINTQETHKED